jgi:hypothetical protein
MYERDGEKFLSCTDHRRKEMVPREARFPSSVLQPYLLNSYKDLEPEVF